MNYDAVVYGFVNPDLIMYPPKGERITFAREIFCHRATVRPAGPGGYTAITMARLGLRCCSIDKVGSDIFGRFMIGELNRFGVDTKYMKVLQDDEPGFTVSIVGKGGEGGTMIAAVPRWTLTTSFEEILSSLKNAPDGKVFYIGVWFPSILPKLKGEHVLEIFRYAKERGFLVGMDINYKPKEGPSREEVRELKNALKYVDVLIPNLRDAEIIVGSKSPRESAHSLLQLGPKIVGLKMGGKGCYVVSKEESALISGHKVNVVDTAGAGDVFDGAFVYGWLKGWKPREIASFANATSALYISQEVDEIFPTAQQVYDFLKRKKGEST